MRKKYLSLLLAFTLAVVFLPVLLLYASPMEATSYSLSYSTDERISQPYNDEAWTVYTMDEHGQQTILTELVDGGYTGLSYPGQTFYYDRELTEVLDSPTLRIYADDCAISVFLDGELLYTDCPDLDNRIGSLTLPMLQPPRDEPVILSLPLNYAGKTLTIAQATDADSASNQVSLCSITLYCSFAYESSLIASTAQHLIPAALLFALGLVILIAFVWSSFFGQIDIGLPLLALLAFLLMCGLVLHAPFFRYYFGENPANWAGVCFHSAITVLLCFLSYRMQVFRRPAFLLMTAQLLAVWYDLWMQYHGQAQSQLPSGVSLVTLLLALLLVFLEWRRGTPFFFQFCVALLVCFGIVFVITIGCLLLFSQARMRMMHGPILMRLQLVTLLYFLSAIAATAVQTASHLIRTHAERSILLAREQSARSSYESLCIQTEHTMELRHDMRKHLTILHTLLSHQKYEQAGKYIDDLVAQNQQIRPIVRCGNQMLDIILNGKLDEAIRHQVRVSVIAAEAPPSLPLSDAELTSLMMNVMDNAVHAALSVPADKRFIELELRVNGNFLLFRCANNAQHPSFRRPDDTNSLLSPHGYGLKIINRILAQYGSISRIENKASRFQISFALPLQ